jgi:hypothetical protein
MGTKYYIAKARVWPYNSFYFVYHPSFGCEHPVLDVVNPAEYEVYEVTAEEYKKHTNKM